MKVDEAILKLFLSIDEARWLALPNVLGEFRHYCEGRVLVRVPAEWGTELGDGEGGEGHLAGFVEREGWSRPESEFVAVVLPEVALKVQPCPRCNGKGRDKCHHCWGRGEHECECGDVHECRSCRGRGDEDCDRCEGSGELETWETEMVHVGGMVWIGAEYAEKLGKLPGLEWAVDDFAMEYLAQRFRFAGGEGIGLIMPRRHRGGQ